MSYNELKCCRFQVASPHLERSHAKDFLLSLGWSLISESQSISFLMLRSIINFLVMSLILES